MKAIISNKIYISTTPELLDEIKDKLTYKFENNNVKKRNYIVERHYAKFRDSVYVIPQGRQDLIPEDYEIIDKRVKVPAKFPKFRGELRPSQQIAVDLVNDSTIINASVSWGKTYAGLGILQKLGQKSLIVVHTVVLRNQWEQKVKELFGIQPGIIGSGRFEIGDTITIANVQTLRKHVNKLRKTFGTVLLDEMHHVSAPTFDQIISDLHARYRIGLSATLKRKDGRHITFPDYFGFKLYDAPPENSMDPVVYSIDSGIDLPEHRDWAVRLNKLFEIKEYEDLIAALCEKALVENRTCLVVADRVEFLERLHSRISNSICITGLVSQDTREELLDKIRNKERKILFGTRSIFSEGISIDSLDCLVLASPINNEPLLEQLIGRIQRIEEGKKTPIVVDIQLGGYTSYHQTAKRLNYYRDKGYKFIKSLSSS